MSRVVVMGLGRFGGGVAAARWFAERGDDVLVTDLRDEATLAASLAEIEPLGVELRLGRHDPDDFRTADLVVVNPAIPFDHPLVRLAPRHVTEIGLTLRRLPGPIVAVTGTNGKSTTVSLIAAMLERTRIPHVLGGNIGRPLLNECASMAPGTVAVLEISSFQLAWLEHDDWQAAAAVVTNLSGDHLDRHKTFEHYRRAKRRLAERVSPAGTLVLNRDDASLRSFARVCPGEVAWVGPEAAPRGLRLLGRHNRLNTALAMRAALAIGASPLACEQAAAEFRPLPHRLEDLGERAGIQRVNDSVSTTPEATAAAVDAFVRPVILLAGGRDKGLELRPLLEAARRAKRVVAYGESGPGIRSELPSAELRPGLDEAVRAALDMAEPGDVVLLSPGFASYDEFPGFDARGERFRQLVDE